MKYQALVFEQNARNSSQVQIFFRCDPSFDALGDFFDSS